MSYGSFYKSWQTWTFQMTPLWYIFRICNISQIQVTVHFILSFKYHEFDAWIRSELPQNVTYVKGNDTFCCFSRQYIYQLSILWIGTGWILQTGEVSVLGGPLEQFQTPNYKNFNKLFPLKYIILLGVLSCLSECVSNIQFWKQLTFIIKHN